eukprot:1389948-Pleurochrysis_carterae.AAC.1
MEKGSGAIAKEGSAHRLTRQEADCKDLVHDGENACYTTRGLHLKSCRLHTVLSMLITQDRELLLPSY